MRLTRYGMEVWLVVSLVAIIAVVAAVLLVIDGTRN